MPIVVDKENSLGFDLDTMKKALEIIAEKGWEILPSLQKYPVLIIRASQCCGVCYTVEHLAKLHEALSRGTGLPCFDDATAKDYLDALKPQVVRTQVA